MDKIYLNIKKLKDGTTKPFEIGDKVIYVPLHLLYGNKEKVVDENNLGTVTSKNGTYVFVQFIGENSSKAVRPEDLYFLNNRPDLMKKIDGHG